MILEDENYIETVSKREAIKERVKDYTIEEVLNIIEQIEFARTKLFYNCNLEMTINTLLLHMKGDVK
jgi:predicted transcriptional regulator